MLLACILALMVIVIGETAQGAEMFGLANLGIAASLQVILVLIMAELA
jgi:hypothetical protein